MKEKSTILIALVGVGFILLGGFFIYQQNIAAPKEEPKKKIEIEIGSQNNPPQIKIETEYERKHVRVWPFVNIETEGEKKK